LIDRGAGNPAAYRERENHSSVKNDM